MPAQTAPTTTLLIRHQPHFDPPAFQVVRLSDGKAPPPVTVSSPVGYPVEGRPDSDLLHELRWYLEYFLDYPFPPETDHAERVLASLKNWGESAFVSLFTGIQAGELLHAATRSNYANLELCIASDDPHVLAWPWEALRDPRLGPLAQTCRISRRLDGTLDPQPPAASLPIDRINILLVVARPFEQDVHYRSIARPLVELIRIEGLPAHVHVLRPPTFQHVRDHLKEHPGYYHILHFDGHGAYRSKQFDGNSEFTYGAREGRLLFEADDGGPAPISAAQISALLREHGVPIVVLNACQSAMIDESAENAFASIATGLLQAGIRSVVAMAYSLYVSGAQRFLPAFYRRLFESGDLAEAVRAGRGQMLAERGRVCARGTYDLEDWLLPVLYQQEVVDLSFVGAARKTFEAPPSRLPAEASDAPNPYGFVGRDGALLELERALRRAPAGILIHGLGGVGKTTLARGFLEWLEATGGLGHGCFWFSFHFVKTRGAEYVVNRMGEALFGEHFVAADLDQRLHTLTTALHKNPFVIVWDNFDVERGIPGTPADATLPEADQQLLSNLLEKLRSGATKVLMTSRSSEDWLGPARRYLLRLGGLEGEERWEYCAVLLRDLGLKIDRNDRDLVELMHLLAGHPLAMRVILPRLEVLSPRQVIDALRSNFTALGLGEGDAENHLAAILRFTEQSLPDELRPLLVPLAIHEGFVIAGYMEAIAKCAGIQATRAQIDRLLQVLSGAGLLRIIGQAVYQIHPLLISYLRSRVLESSDAENRDRWVRGFVDTMGRLVTALTPRPLHEQRVPFHLYEANFHHALTEAERLGMDTNLAVLTQGLAVFAENTGNLATAERLFQRFADYSRDRGEFEGEAAAYHHLGMIAKEREDLVTAGAWCKKSLAISEEQGYEHNAAITYDLLGVIAHKRRDFAAAVAWYEKSLAIKERLGQERTAATTYHHLGTIAEGRRDFVAAEEWYRKSLAIAERLGDEHGAAMTYYQLGVMAQERQDFVVAEAWYRKSLAIEERLGQDHGASLTCHQLGSVARLRRDFVVAEEWYRKSLVIKERLGQQRTAATTYDHLGLVAEERRDLAAAEAWYRKSLAIKERLGDEHGAALTWVQLGILDSLRGNYEQSGRRFVEVLEILWGLDDPDNTGNAVNNFLVNYQAAPPLEKAKLRAMWEEAGLPPLP